MAAMAIPSSSFMAAFLPVAQASLLPQAAVRRVPLLQRLQTSILPAVIVPIPGFLGSIWEGILKAVPKKKTSHRKKRQRFMAGKALKDVTFLVKCSSCGRPKRAHILCPYCVASIKQWLSSKFGAQEEIDAEAAQVIPKVKPELRLISKEKRAAYEGVTLERRKPPRWTPPSKPFLTLKDIKKAKAPVETP